MELARRSPSRTSMRTRYYTNLKTMRQTTTSHSASEPASMAIDTTFANPADDVADAGSVAHVELQRMPHELHIRHAGEDWAGITNRAKRKQLQNRLNKRVSRQRKRDNATSVGSSSNSPTSLSSGSNSPSPDDVEASFSYCTAETITFKRAVLNRFAESALQSYATADPCADHRLKLIQLNIINGLTHNATSLGFSFDWLVCEVVSPFGHDPTPVSASAAASSAIVPSSLTPTTMQLQTKHHPWVDLFPLPTLRNNLLMASTTLPAEDEQRLYDDILESGGGRGEWAGLMVWGEPSDFRNWEISLPFMRKWGWLLQGCPEIIEATNHWRSLRGEKPLSIPGSGRR